jgi:chloramphenicol O-acetyltransferase type A
MKTRIDPETWPRKDHFAFFRQFDEPFFGFTVEVDCTEAYRYCKENGHSFFLYYLHKSLTAVHQVEEFRFRILDGEVWTYDRVMASPTISRPDGTFGYAYFEFLENFLAFAAKATPELDLVRQTHGLKPAIAGEDVIHYSSIPWINFTGLTHARIFSRQDSIPKICFGKMTEEGTRRRMPMSVHGHHGLMDAYHIGQYIDRFQDLLLRAE